MYSQSATQLLATDNKTSDNIKLDDKNEHDYHNFYGGDVAMF